MDRLALTQLLAWKHHPYRKPLLLKGVRQVGKTWLLKTFGATHYENTAYFNFDEHSEYAEFFSRTKEVPRILENLRLVSGQKIAPEKTLIVFDEIQNAPAAINALKYFRETAPEYHVACAGSLLGVTLARPASFPVGQVDFLDVHPMTFTEFLLATGDENLVTAMKQVTEIEPLMEAFFNPLVEKLRLYFITGGMPEAVLRWSQTHDLQEVATVLRNLLNAYENDFLKHPKISEVAKILLTWRSLPAQLARENKKFLYKLVKEGARAREYEDAVQWLINAGHVHKITRVTTPGLPLSAYEDLGAFKLYASDIGILRELAQLPAAAFDGTAALFSEFKGALAENFVLTSLIAQTDLTPCYWSQLNPSYEVDFLLQRGADVIPLEVKAATNVRSPSLRKYKELFGAQTRLRVRFSLENLRLDGDMLNIPLFMADQADRLIGLALEHLSGAPVKLANKRG